MKSTAVVKFGGSSLSNSDKFIFVAHRIKSFKKKYKNVVAVLSAPADITDNLLKLSEKFIREERALDMLLSSGENISISLMQMSLKKIGIKSIALNPYQAEIITTNKYSDADIISLNQKRIMKLIKSGYVVILPGFTGISKKLDITTLGRGGSDYTAVYVSDVLDADCYLLSDMAGVYSSNPAKIENAVKIKDISYTELFEIAKVDSEIRQTKALEYAFKRNLSLYLGSTFNISTPTLIKNYPVNHKPVVKYISIKTDENRTKIIFIGENIYKRTDLIDEIKKFFDLKLNIKRNKIKLDFNRSLSSEDLNRIYKRFIFY